MCVAIEIWRCRIGCFSQPVKVKTALQVLTLSRASVSLSVRVVLFLLLAMHGVEQNPGPRSRGGNSRGGRGRGQDRDANIAQNENDLFSQSSNAPQTRRSTRQYNDQTSLNAWLTNTRSPSNVNSQNARALSSERNVSPPPSVASSMDSYSDTLDPAVDHDTTIIPSQHERLSMTILIDIQKDCKNLNRKFDKLDKSVNDLKKENKKKSISKCQTYESCKYSCCECVRT